MSAGGLRAQLRVPGRLGVEIRAEAGDVLAVVGPNGAGKTTLLRCLAGLRPDCGEIVVGTRSWTTPPLAPRQRRVGYVVQGQALFPHLSARDNVAFGLRARGVDARTAAKRAQSELDRLGVGELADRRPGRLSGGQAQRVALARALATEPEILLLDEPFSGLDVTVAAAARIELRTHLDAFAGITVLVTHDAVDALTLGNRMLVLQDGAVAQSGTPGEVAAQPRTQHIARLVGLNLLETDGGHGETGGELLAFRPADVTLSLSEQSGSARLRWQGTVAHLTPLADIVRVTLEVAGPTGRTHVLADVTSVAAAELGLAPGLRVWASAKETALTRYPIHPPGDDGAPIPSGHGD